MPIGKGLYLDIAFRITDDKFCRKFGVKKKGCPSKIRR